MGLRFYGAGMLSAGRLPFHAARQPILARRLPERRENPIEAGFPGAHLRRA